MANKVSGDAAISPHAQLWRNPNLIHFFEDPDPIIWTKFGIKTLGDIVGDGETPSV